MPRTGRPQVFDNVKQQLFLRLLAGGLSARDAARCVGVSRSTVFDKKHKSPAFAAACEQAKFQTLPALLEHVHAAGARSWRASAWLLERIRPELFGRRVALGIDPAATRPPKPRPASVADEQMIADFIDSLRLLPEAQAIAKEKLAQLEDQQHAWDAARKAYAEEIDRRGTPRDFISGDYIPFPSSLASTETSASANPRPDAPDPSPDANCAQADSSLPSDLNALAASPDSNKSNNSAPLEHAQLQPVQPQPPTAGVPST